ncbi:transfer protein spdA [Streptomyces sp. NPDC005506]|uniref:transfer protein spdA n=1 Tax=Streptomyces sp. NPDC005506 TaxID=3364718 RepID=UPI0036D0A9FA
MPAALPWYARVAAVVGRPLVLLAALAMSAPGEYRLAAMAGWTASVAWLMPVSLSVYAAVAAVIAATRPKGTSGRGSALIGAGMALSLALSAQVTAHLIASGYMGTSAFLVAATSAVPPLVVAHMLHLAAVTPVTAPDTPAGSEVRKGRYVAAESVSQPDPVTAPAPVVAEPVPAVSAPEITAPAPAETLPDMWPDADLWADFEGSAPDTEPVTPPSAADVRAVMASLAAEHGRPVSGRMLADHYSVSERTGRRYLAMAA